MMYSERLKAVEGRFSFAGIISLLVLLLRMLPGAYIVAQHEAVIQSLIFHCLQVPIQLEFSS